MTEDNDSPRPEDEPSEEPQKAPDPAPNIPTLKEKAVDAFKQGAEEAKESFEKSFPNAKEDFAKGINDASYAIGYAVSFGSALIREFTPDNVTDGFERGSQAGNKAAEEVIEHRKARQADSPEDCDPTPT
ncbi:MAG: hypothetical protein P1V20_05750 [Verrucomicrobiales bacterium]|nr:hypothetical protein [Verrucomicrobiales bacterium]